jgi:two-component system sensor histidine kinase KdpD
LILLAITVVGMMLPLDYYRGLGFVYLLAVILLGLRVRRGVALWASLLSVALWDFVFLPFNFSFVVQNLSDAMLLGLYFLVALVIGQITVWIRDQVREKQVREERATNLLHLTRALAAAKTLDEAAANSLRLLEELLKAKTALALETELEGPPAVHAVSSYALDEREMSAAQAAMRLRHPTGRFTQSYFGRAGYYVPLLLDDRVLGVLGARVPANAMLTERQRELLDVFSRQLAIIVEREHLRAAVERDRLLSESAKLHRTLLESVSHELRTPLAVITSALENLGHADPALREDLLGEARTAARRLNRLVGNLLDQTRLESGTVKPRLDWCDARDIVNAALDGTREALEGHPLTVAVPPGFPLVRADFALTEHALANLLFNAAQHTPAGTPVAVTAGLDDGGGQVFFTVADRGPGFPSSMRGRLFHKFARGEAARSGGLGLGLSLVRGFIAAQGGEVLVGENSGAGATITLYLPHVPAENPPPD